MKVKTVPFLMCVAVMLAVLQGCASLQRLPAVPEDSTTRAGVLGIPNVRFFVDDDLSPYLKEAMASLDREKAFLAKSGHVGEMPPANFLALSGGGDDGAFGAGLLVGWTQSGTRPQFKLVTGISTGALIAPFAFLGPDYDHLLKEFYTGAGPKDIYETRSILSVITGDSLSQRVALPMPEHDAPMQAQELTLLFRASSMMLNTVLKSPSCPTFWGEHRRIHKVRITARGIFPEEDVAHLTCTEIRHCGAGSIHGNEGKRNGASVAEINLESTPYSVVYNMSISGESGEILPRLL
jgi:hypothetical protein